MIQAIYRRIIKKSVLDLHTASYILAGLSLLSMFLALIRERFFATLFGAGGATDIYFTAFRIPDILFISIASFISVYALLPSFEEKRENMEELKRFIDSIFSFFSSLIIVVSILTWIVMPHLVSFFFYAFSESAQGSIVFLSRLLLIQMILLGISNFFASIAQFKHRFILYGLSPILYNVGIIIGIIILAPLFGVTGVVYGVLLGSLFHMSLYIPFLYHEGFFPHYRNPFLVIRDAWEVIRLSLPRTFVLFLQTLTIFAITIIATHLSTGSVSVFSYSYTLMHIPLTLIGVSYSVAAFPTLTRLFVNNDIIIFKERIRSALRHVVFWSLAAMVLFLLLRAHIVRIILGGGEFDWYDTRLTAASLVFLSLIVLFQSISFLIIRSCYAGRHIRVPIIAAFTGFLTSTAVAFFSLFAFENNLNDFNTFLIELLRVEDIPGNEVVILPFALLIGSFIQFLFLMGYFHKKYSVITLNEIISFSKSILAAVILFSVTYLSLNISSVLFSFETFLSVLAHAVLAVVIGVTAWILTLIILRSEEYHDIYTLIKEKVS